MAETMEQYMSKTRSDYGSGVARPKIKDNDNFELKFQFIKELRDNTFSGSDHEDANEHIEKVLEIVDLFHIPNITIDQEDLKTQFLSKYCPPARTAKKMEEINNFQQEPDENLYQAWERFKELLMKCPQHYLMEMQEVVLFYNGLDVPTRQILDSRRAIPSKTAANAKVVIIRKWLTYSQNGTWTSRTMKFSVLEDMDAYRDEGMGDVIFGEPFLREVGINAKRFKGMITIHNGNEEVTTNGQLRSVPYLDIFTGFVTYGVIQFKDTAYWSPA
ncbi:putative reverse transcriptase domain-containing protein [Tanacetum coccineum]